MLCRLILALIVALPLAAETLPPVLGITGAVSNVALLNPQPGTPDVDLKRMAEWAMNYLARTPRKELGYEPVFQCHPLACPPTPAGQDPVVACDTDARMDWEWFYMRDISGSQADRDVENAFHQRIRSYIAPDGKVWSHPGAFNEGNTTIKYSEADRVIHIWGATKILMSLSLYYERHHDEESKQLARKVMLALKGLATWDDAGRCWFKCGMGAFKPDGSVSPNGWNRQPAPIVEPLVTYYLATKDAEGLAFARAYADGMMANCQPASIHFETSGEVTGSPHSHATTHAVWGIAHLGVVTGDARYSEFARKFFDWMLTRGTGTGWFPAGPDNCNETCCVSDMISLATLIGRSGHPEYFDYAERYFRNYIANLQFIVTPEFEAHYRELNKAKGAAAIDAGLVELRKFQGGIIGGSGLNDYENQLLGGASGFEMFGCCAPEGMRAIHTVWADTIEPLAANPLGAAGVYVNFGFSRKSDLGEVTSSPSVGRLAVRAARADVYFVRVPHWAPREKVRAFLNGKAVETVWAGSYVRFDARAGDQLAIQYPMVEFDQTVAGLWKSCAPSLSVRFHWAGNTVVSSDPVARGTALFSGAARVLPAAP